MNQIIKHNMWLENIGYLLIASIVGAFFISLPRFNSVDFFTNMGVMLIILVVQFSSKELTAGLLGCSIKLNLWSVRRYWFGGADYLKWPFPMWLFFPFIIGLITNWKLRALTLLTHEVTGNTTRVGRKFTEVSEYDIARITMAGFAAIFIMGIIFKSVGIISFANIAMIFIIINMLPIGKLDGSSIFFSSRYLWVSLFAFMLIAAILMNVSGILSTIFLSLIAAVMIVVIYYYRAEM